MPRTLEDAAQNIVTLLRGLTEAPGVGDGGTWNVDVTAKAAT
jgi:hypothetical protein